MRGDAGRATDTGCYELGAELKLRRVEDAKAHQFVKDKAAIPHAVISADAASVLVVDDKGKRWRLPKGDAAFDVPGGRLEEQHYTIYRDLRSWTGALIFRVRDDRVGPTDLTVAVMLSLKAFPRFALGRDRDESSSLLGY